ncbi:MAG: hypothetical protein KR126chlam6_00868 [Candidatus Anoxychlamydiales bacterium]|nr:hypothetical protein [Candidatus Anoxychlamydiales bacterium]
MLTFFRKYQKIFFIFIAFVIIVSFSFFGTQGVLDKVNKVKDRDIATAIDGSKIKESKVQRLSFFLATDFADMSIRHNHLRPNLFNDGVLRNDFFKTDLAKVFFEKYFDVLKPSFEKKLEKIQKYTPFVHFYDSSISASKIYEMYSPNVLNILKELKSQKEVNLKFLNLLVDLYNEQMKLPSETIRRFLVFQERQKKIEQDPRLYQDSIAIFGYENAQDWFGKDFLDLISQFIINTSIVAKTKGYDVSIQEASANLVANLNASLDEKAKESINSYYKNVLGYLGLDEKKAALVWRDVMLFRRYFQDVANNTLIDNLALDEFDKYSKTNANIKLYSLPNSLKIKNFEDLMLFEMYLTATTDRDNSSDLDLDLDRDRDLGLNQKLKNISDIEKMYPELIEKKYSVSVKHIDIEKAALRVKVKDMYFWQLEDKSWNQLRNKFTFLSYAKTKDDKLTAIDKLNMMQKFEIDAFARILMVKDEPNIIDEALKNESDKKYDFYISSKNPTLPISVKDQNKLVALLDKQDILEKYSDDETNFYSIRVNNRDSNKKIVSFEKAKENKVIDKILENFLQKNYLALRENIETFQNEDGSFKTFQSVKTKVGEIVFSDTIHTLRSLNLTKDRSLDKLSQYRAYPYTANVAKNLKINENYKQLAPKQFQLICKDEKISRSKKPNWIEKDIFSMGEKKYSNLHIADSNIEFFYLDNFSTSKDKDSKTEIAKNAIYSETSSLLAKKLIKRFEEKKCIQILSKDV